MDDNISRICLDVFIDHWQQIIYAINQSDDNSNTEIIFKHVDILVSIIIKECDEGMLLLNDILQYCDSNSIFQTIFIHFNRENLNGNIKEYGIFNQLRMYDNILNFLPSNYLMRHHILSPLLKLLEECSLRQSVKIEHLSVRLLYQLTVLVTRDSDLFNFIKDTSNRNFHEPLFFIGLIILLIHRDKDIGRLSQEALLLIFNYSKDDDSDVVEYICHRSDFSAILATGLSGLYSSFPRKLDNFPDDWQQITLDFVLSIPDLKHSLELLDFCNLIVKMSHPKIQGDILDYLYTGFLSPVIGPSLHQNSLEETISATAYLELFLRHLHQPSLIKLFLQFILMEKKDNYVVLDSLINRLNSLTMVDISMYNLGVVTLSLFRTMLSFHCEDVMFHLVYKYLIPGDHLIKQKWAQPYLTSSDEDLSHGTTRIHGNDIVIGPKSNMTNTINENLSNSADQFLKLSFGTTSDEDNENMARSSLMNRINQYNTDLRRASQSPAVMNNLQRFSSVSPFYSYLHSAALYVNRRILASNSWSLSYDGVNPPPQIFELIDNSHDRWQQKFPFSCNVKKSDETIRDDGDEEEEDDQLVIESSPSYPVDLGKVKDVGYYSSNNGSGSNISRQVPDVLPLYAHDKDDSSIVNRLCDPSPSSKAIYKLNYFSFDPQLADIECMDNSMDVPLAEADEVENAEMEFGDRNYEVDVNMDNVVLSTDDECALVDFLVSLDLLEVHQYIDWDLEWNDVNKLLTQHNITFYDNRHRSASLITISPVDSFTDDDVSSRTSTPTNEVIFKQRLQSFDQSIYLSPNHSNFSVTLGPFLTAIFQRLRSLPTNTVFMNLLITGIITDLASYPHPLTKSLILDIDIILQPHISKLYEIALDVRESLILESSSIPNWESVLVNAYEYLYSRIDVCHDSSSSGMFLDDEFDITLSTMSPVGSINSSLFDFEKFSMARRPSSSSSPRTKEKKSRKMSAFGLLSRKKKKDDLGQYRFPVHKFCYSKKKPLTEADSQHIRNLAYGWVIFDEFCKELASLCQEHTQHCFF